MDKPIEKDSETGRFVTGNIGGGRPKGARNKLGEAFFGDMFEAWQSQGKSVIAAVIEKDPAAFLRSMVAIMPKQVEVDINQYDSMTDDQLKQQFLAALREANALGLDVGAGVTEGTNQEAPRAKAGAVRPVH